MNHNNICPECKAGKHPNCTRMTIDDYDDFVPCECPARTHPDVVG